MDIPILQWPDHLKRLAKIFSQINTNLSFILSHSRATIPSFKYFEKLIPHISIYDLACIKYFLKDDVYLGYIDKEELMTESKKVNYSFKKGYEMSQPDTIDQMYESIALANEGPSQVLIFTFEDMKLDNIGAVSKFRDNKLDKLFNGPDLSRLSQPQLFAVIKARNNKFQKSVSNFISESGVNTDDEIIQDHLRTLASPFIPKKPEFIDPVQSMAKRQRLATFGSSENLSALEMVDLLKKTDMYRDQIVFEGIFNESKLAKYEHFNVDLYNVHPSLVIGIQQYKGIDISTQLYSHQTEALESIMGDTPKNVIISTSTSSGKSLIYQIPILNEILWDIEAGPQRYKKRHSTAIFIFPTKALAQDQKKHLQDLITHIPLPTERNIIVDTYDGDTEAHHRRNVKKNADIIFTNPDTIHASILPNFEGSSISNPDNSWQEFLLGLKFVVVDEIHVYKGTFGINVSFVMSRLLRVLSKSCSNTNLRFISCSATVLNPADHFKIICSIPPESEVVHVHQDGSASCEKRLLVWRPPALMNKRGETVSEENPDGRMVPRVNNILELARLLLLLLANSKTIKVLVFCPIRAACESLMKQIRDLHKSEFSDSHIDARDIMAYRGGYSKYDRRQIEQKMFNGEVRALVATNALELGVDLSDLDVVITCGFPILKLNMHQQFGRAGRGRNSKGSLAIFVAGGVPLDQYYMKHADELMDKSSYEDLCVSGLIEAGMHKIIMENHLQCAAFELPIDIDTDAKWFCNYDLTNKKVKLFKDACNTKLNKDKFGRFRTNPEYLPWPSNKVAIRAIELPAYAVVDITNDRNIIIEEVEESRTSFTLYEGGIFLHQGLTYLVKEFNTEKKFAKVERVQVDWTTSQRDFTDVDPHQIEYIRCLKSPMREVADIPAYFGTIETTTIVFGFFKINKKNEIIEAVEVKNPPVHFFSKGLWLDIPRPVLDALAEKKLSSAGGIHAAQHTLMNVLPLYISGLASTDPNAKFSTSNTELLTECKAPEKEFAKRQTKRKRPARLIFFDSKGGPEGSGVSAKVFEYIDEILMAAYDRINSCDCEWGCPKCVTPSFCTEMLQVMSKPAAYIILGVLVGRDLEELKNEVADGPELNMPDISVETIAPASSVVKMSPDIEILEVKRSTEPLKYIKKEPET